MLDLLPSPWEPVTGTDLSHRAYCYRRETALNTLFLRGRGLTACRVLVPQPGIEIMPPEVETVLITGCPPGEVLGLNNLIKVE